MEIGSEHAEISASGALVPEKGLAGLEFQTPFSVVVGFAVGVGVWLELEGEDRVLGYGVEEKWRRR